jgi:hypothetical protein
MAFHPLFRERVDELIAEHKKIATPKPRIPAPSGDIY